MPIGDNLSPSLKKKLYDLTTKTWLKEPKSQRRMLSEIKFVATKDDSLLAAILISDETDDPRLTRARDAFVTMAMLIEGEKYSALQDEFHEQKRVLFVERETAGHFWNAAVSKSGPRYKNPWWIKILGISPARKR